ncbi:DUF6232 family protein [Hufsiella ginkgonis]|uniref:QacE n=1 Tax=Hufsiella ginkgonis TaxID=2695274 RepID=A0A7K1XU44_9SPHI|nr:DUF6232 family protein [Hufsiella ginkgonis]MXV14317.1 hypothetical protein [Hufsiella ginkgonis]
METINETTFYQDTTVVVTQSRFKTGSKTYAMRNISSVHVFEIKKSRTAPVLLVVAGLLMLLSEDARGLGAVLLVAGIILLLVIKNEFAVRISTNSGEANSIVSKNREYVQGIVDALSDAIIHRG